MNRRNRILIGAGLLALTLGSVSYAFTTGDHKWGTNVVTMYVNANGAHTTAASAEEALKAAMAAWGSQSNANIQFAYGGPVNDTSTGFDYRNVTIFRQGTSGGMLASTYSWWAGATLATATLVDADVIFWDGQMQFFGAYDTCYGGGGYIQDIATHEYGHALGLGHSNDGNATMYGGYNACSTEQRTLSADDIAGIEHLYPPAGGSTGGSTGGGRTSDAAPSVSISSPGNSTVPTGTPITFSATATDGQDGNLNGALWWSSSLIGYFGLGANFAAVLPIGTHVIRANVSDSSGLSSYAEVTVTVGGDPAVAPAPSPAPSPEPSPAPALSGPTLTVRAYKTRGMRRADLAWWNISATSVTIYRDGALVYSGGNNEVYLDVIGGKGAGTFTYQVCDGWGGQCTNPATASF